MLIQDVVDDLPDSVLRILLDEDPEIGKVANRYFLRRTLGDPAMSMDWRRAIEYMDGNVPRTGRIVDIGCGPGTFLLYLRILGFQQIAGTDHDHNKIRWAARMLSRVAGSTDYSLLCGHSTEPLLRLTCVHVMTAFGWAFEDPSYVPALLGTAAPTVIFSLPLKRQSEPGSTRCDWPAAKLEELVSLSGRKLITWIDDTVATHVCVRL
jgi:SAM-dependent methyltransferase